MVVAALNALPKTQVLYGSFAVAAAASGVLFTMLKATAKPVPTDTPKWRAATKDYNKFQGANPIFGTK